MQINVYQECRSAEGWQPVKVQSSSDPDTTYVVTVNPWGADDENICECKGYLFRGSCKHQRMAPSLICSWQEKGLHGHLEQSEEQRMGMICPKCGGPTKWQIEVQDV